MSTWRSTGWARWRRATSRLGAPAIGRRKGGVEGSRQRHRNSKPGLRSAACRRPTLTNAIIWSHLTTVPRMKSDGCVRWPLPFINAKVEKTPARRSVIGAHGPVRHDLQRRRRRDLNTAQLMRQRFCCLSTRLREYPTLARGRTVPRTTLSRRGECREASAQVVVPRRVLHRDGMSQREIAAHEAVSGGRAL